MDRGFNYIDMRIENNFTVGIEEEYMICDPKTGELINKADQIMSLIPENLKDRRIEITGPVDIIDVFRPSEQVLSIVEEAIKKKPKVIWLQEGIHNIAAEKLATDAGIDIVFNRCMLAEHQRLM